MSRRATKPMSHPEMRALVEAYATCRRAVADARTKPMFLKASSDLWDIERQLDEEGRAIALETEA